MPRGPTKRIRSLPYRIPGRRQFQRNESTQPGVLPSEGINLNTPSKAFLGTQTTVSEGHQFPPPKGVTDAGGEFSTVLNYVIGNAKTYSMKQVVEQPIFPIYKGTSTYRYDGPLIPFDPTVNNGFSLYPTFSTKSDSDLDKMGATAVARCKPTNSVADASVFLGELMQDGIPKLAGVHTWEQRTLDARLKAQGEEYLNYQFGWLPLSSDIRKFANAIVNAETVMKQYERDAGKVVRRRYDFPIEEQTIDRGKVAGGAPYGPADSVYFVGTSGTTGEIHRVDRLQRKVWFSGAFTYYLPNGYDSRSAMSRAALEAEKVFGLKLTPETVWNLTPWSWAVDWFSNAGDVLSNISAYASDGLVMRYGYIMEHVLMTSTYTHTGTKYKSGHNVQPLVAVIETKKTEEG